MKPLAFKVPSRAAQEYEPIGDEITGIVDVKRLGCFTPAEEIAWSDYLVNQITKQSTNEAKVDIVSFMLRLRHDPAWTREDTIAQIQDFRLIERLYDFFVAERSRHAPKTQLLRVDGEQAYEIARSFAQQHNAVCASRKDFVALNVWFVFHSVDDLPADFEFAEADNFSQEEVDDLAVGKSKTK